MGWRDLLGWEDYTGAQPIKWFGYTNTWAQPGDTFTFTTGGESHTYVWQKNAFGQWGWKAKRE